MGGGEGCGSVDKERDEEIEERKREVIGERDERSSPLIKIKRDTRGGIPVHATWGEEGSSGISAFLSLVALLPHTHNSASCVAYRHHYMLL